MDTNLNITINDFNSICRLCLNKDRRLKFIFETKIENDDCKSEPMHQVIAICFGLNINPDDGLPLSLCGKCFTKVSDFHTFRIQCHASNDLLKTLKFKGYKDCDNVKDNWPIDHHTNKTTESIDETIDSKSNIQHVLTPPISINKNNAKSFVKSEIISNLSIPSLIETNNKILESSDALKKTHCPKEKAKEISIIVKNKVGRPKTKIDRPKRTKLTEEEKKIRLQLSKQKSRAKKVKTICTICGKFVKNLSTHMKLHKIKEKGETVECDYCKQIFSHKLLLTGHFRTHFKTRKYQCTECAYKFLSPIHLRNHLRTHTNVKPFTCDICSKKYRQPMTLKQHKKSHYRIYDIPCPYCDKMFLTRNNLKSHIGIHTGEKPYKCDWCNAAFVASSSLAIHRKKHNQDGHINQCKICQIICDSKAILRNHLRVNHGIEYNKHV